MPKVSSLMDGFGIILVTGLAVAILNRGSQAADLVRAIGSSVSGLIDAAQN